MTLLEWLDRIEEARIVVGELTDPTARKAVLQPKPMSVSEPRLGQFVPAARSSQKAAISGLASATTTANRTEEPRHTLSAFIYVFSVALVAAATIVSFGVASFSFLNTNEEAALRAFLPEGAAAYNMQPSEASGPQPGSEQPGLGTSAASATEGASRNGTMPTLSIPDAQRDQVFREFEMLLSNYAGFWSDRLRKECGPIKDPQLLDHCVRSFRAQYPVHRR